LLYDTSQIFKKRKRRDDTIVVGHMWPMPDRNYTQHLWPWLGEIILWSWIACPWS